MSAEAYLHALHVVASPLPSTSSPSSGSGAQHQQQQPRRRAAPISSLDSVRLMQCVFYLRRYGTPRQLLNFWLRHCLIDDAVRYALGARLPATLFIEAIVRPTIRAGRQPLLFSALRQLLDAPPAGGLGAAARDYIGATCQWLSECGALTLLVDWLQLAGDWHRLGVCCVQLFLAETNSAIQLRYLEQAKHYVSESLSRPRHPPSPSSPHDSAASAVSAASAASAGIEAMSGSELLKLITLQSQLSRALMSSHAASASGGSSGTGSSSSSRSNQQQQQQAAPAALSLFGPHGHKCALAEQLLVANNFELAFQIMHECRLPVRDICQQAVCKLALASKRQAATRINDLLRNIKGTIDDDDWDLVVEAAIAALASSDGGDDVRSAEKLVGKLVGPERRVIGYLRCGKLKTAYLTAVKLNSRPLVMQIRDEAQRTDSRSVLELCQKYLAQQLD
eukprot:TRINITY_DN7579_c1_g1_i2.p1 TRINITY_DN7579_c1_g1~~TRINITY_DN7579_c1_g1_i2.p1  ORF type:complete len:450 (+),score=218.03 TRINITY_DN7579_c1_g1_i2:1190-2539(+)